MLSVCCLLLGSSSLAYVLSPPPARCAAPTMMASANQIPMPAALEQMGCDAAMWSKIRAKDAFVKLLDAGDEAGAKERLDKLRNAPSISGTKLAMPAVLASWGCDEALWEAARSKQNLYNLASQGDEAAGKLAIEKLKAAVAKEAARPPLPPKAPKAPKQKSAKGSNSGKGSAKKLGEYALEGEAPAGVDLAMVEKMLSDRVAAKLAKDFDAADKLQEELKGLGVYTNDRLRTWSSEPSAKQVQAK